MWNSSASPCAAQHLAHQRPAPPRSQTARARVTRAWPPASRARSHDAVDGRQRRRRRDDRAGPGAPASGYAVPSITSRVARSGARAAASSAISEPMLWPTSAARSHAGGVEQRQHPVGHRLDAGQRRAGAAPVAGQVDRQHGVAVVGEPARLQGPARCGRAARRGRRRRRAGRGRRACRRCRRRPRGRRTLSFMRAFSADLEGALQVVDQVVGVLQADRQPDRAGR